MILSVMLLLRLPALLSLLVYPLFSFCGAAAAGFLHDFVNVMLPSIPSIPDRKSVV